MKTCTKCGEEKPLDQYYRDKRATDGRASACAPCYRLRAKAYREENAEKIRQKNAKHYAENVERYREVHAAWRKNNPEKMLAIQAAYREANREAIRAYTAANPHVDWESGYRGRVRKHGHEPVIESFTRDQLIARYGDACHHCGGPFEQLDHYPVPVAQGGPHSLDNCVPSCIACNKHSWRTTA